MPSMQSCIQKMISLILPFCYMPTILLTPCVLLFVNSMYFQLSICALDLIIEFILLIRLVCRKKEEIPKLLKAGKTVALVKL